MGEGELPVRRCQVGESGYLWGSAKWGKVQGG